MGRTQVAFVFGSVPADRHHTSFNRFSTPPFTFRVAYSRFVDPSTPIASTPQIRKSK